MKEQLLLIKNEDTPMSILLEMAQNIDAPIGVLLALLKNKYEEVRDMALLSIAQSSGTPAMLFNDLSNKIFGEGSIETQVATATNPNTPFIVLFPISQNEDTDSRVLEALLDNENTAIRESAEKTLEKKMLALKSDLAIFYDYDSTLNNLCHTWIGWLNFTYDLDYKVSDVDSWEWFYDLHNSRDDIDVFAYFDDAMPYLRESFSCVPLYGAQDFVAKSTRFTKYPITILTATHCLSLVDQKNEHIYEHFNDVDVIHTAEKHYYAYNHEKCVANVIMDDKAQSCIDWVKNGGIAFLFTHNEEYVYSKTDFQHENLYIVKNYEEADAILQDIIQNEKHLNANPQAPDDEVSKVIARNREKRAENKNKKGSSRTSKMSA